MPRIPDHPCAHPGCSRLLPSGTKYCPEHTPLHRSEVRSAHRRGYGAAWQKARRAYLADHPLCVMCLKQGRYVRATDVDHIIPHRGDRTLFWDRENWQALCHRCHSVKTRREDHRPEYHY